MAPQTKSRQQEAIRLQRLGFHRVQVAQKWKIDIEMNDQTNGTKEWAVVYHKHDGICITPYLNLVQSPNQPSGNIYVIGAYGRILW